MADLISTTLDPIFVQFCRSSIRVIDAEAVQRIEGFESYMEEPGTFFLEDEAAHQTLADLLSSFTLHLVDPVSQLVVEAESLGQVTLEPCNCNLNQDPLCMSAFCIFTQTGCGASAGEPCTGCYMD